MDGLRALCGVEGTLHIVSLTRSPSYKQAPSTTRIPEASSTSPLTNLSQAIGKVGI